MHQTYSANLLLISTSRQVDHEAPSFAPTTDAESGASLKTSVRIPKRHLDLAPDLLHLKR